MKKRSFKGIDVMEMFLMENPKVSPSQLSPHINYSLPLKIKLEREKLGLSQEMMSERIECNSSLISYIETGRFSSNSLQYLKKIAKALKIDLINLFEV